MSRNRMIADPRPFICAMMKDLERADSATFCLTRAQWEPILNGITNVEADAYLRGQQMMRDRAAEAFDEWAGTEDTPLQGVSAGDVYEIVQFIHALPLIPLDTATPLDKETEK